MSKILQAVAKQLSGGRKTQKLIAEYANDLSHKDGRNRGILDSTKFEKYLWLFQDAFGRDKLNELLHAVYVCSGDQFGVNHAAISYLLQSRKALACLTTNFDNAIELSYPRDNLQIADHYPDPPAVPTRDENPVLLKLHGDATRMTCVASAPELSEGALKARYQFLEEYLRGRNILVIGYSGTGDIDIAPHLRRVDANLFWCDRSEANIPRFQESQINVICDLSVTDAPTVTNHNLLVELAQYQGAHLDSHDENYDGLAHLGPWFEQFDSEQLETFVISQLSWQTSWPHVHINTFRRQEDASETAELDTGRALLQVAAYRSAISAFDHYLSHPSATSLMRQSAITQLAFAYWRMGMFEKAANILKPIWNPSQWAALSEDERRELVGPARIYLEMIIELMQYKKTPTQRSAIFTKFEGELALAALRRLTDEFEHGYLERVAELSSEALAYPESKLEALDNLFDEATAMEEWPSASLLAQLFLLFSLSRGIRTLLKTTKELYGRHSYKLIFKNLAFFIYVLMPGRPPFILKMLNGRWLMPFFVTWLESVYAFKQKTWVEDFRKERYRIET